MAPCCAGELERDCYLDGGERDNRTGRGMQEPRPARYALLRREQRSRRRRADRSAQDGKIPSTLVFAYTPVEDPAVYRQRVQALHRLISRKCTGKRVVYYPVQSNSAEIEAMRSGRLHIAGFSTGPTGFAVNLAGAVPFAAKGTEKGLHGYHLLSVVQSIEPLPETSRSQGAARRTYIAVVELGQPCAARAIPAGEGLTPDADYNPLMSGGHDKSALGVASGDYDMAPVASDVLERMVTRGTIKSRRTSASSSRARCSRPRHSPTRTTSKPDLARKIGHASSISDFTPEMREGIQRQRPLLPDQLSETLEGGARDRGKNRHAVQQGGV